MRMRQDMHTSGNTNGSNRNQAGGTRHTHWYTMRVTERRAIFATSPEDQRTQPRNCCTSTVPFCCVVLLRSSSAYNTHTHHRLPQTQTHACQRHSNLHASDCAVRSPKATPAMRLANSPPAVSARTILLGLARGPCLRAACCSAQTFKMTSVVDTGLWDKTPDASMSSPDLPNTC